jgi:L-iditol 2-dehydrogenase
MKAIVKIRVGEGQLELKDWPEPAPAADEIKLQIAYAGICGTDIHILKDEWPCKPPVVLGHEFCGTVVEIGQGIRNFMPGDRVVASNPAQTCGICSYCRAGNPFMCAKRISAGYMIDGAFAEYLCIREERCHHLPDNVSFRQAALGEPLSVAVRAVIERTTVHSGDLVLVSGPGCVGILVTLIAKLEGATVIVTGTAKDQQRLVCAKEMGADVVVDISREDPLEAVRRYSSGVGADLVYECAGVASSLNMCWEAVKREGTLVPVGIYPGPINTDFNKVTMKDLRVIGSFGYVWSSWQRSIRLLSDGKVNVEGLISHELPLSRFEDAFRWSQDGSAIKVVLNPAMV